METMNADPTFSLASLPSAPNGQALKRDNTCSQEGAATASEWSLDSWRSKSIKQGVDYEDASALDKVVVDLKRSPPLVTPYEIDKLKRSLKDVAHGKAFLLQGGDCAELFDYCQQDVIESKIKLLLQMSLVLIWGLNKPVVRIARMAGQYAKPRSSPTEVVGGREIPSFRGDILNGYQEDERNLDPRRLQSAYFHSAATLNYLRAALSSGFADLHSPLDWGLGHVRDQGLQDQYAAIVASITESLRFMKTVGADTAGQLSSVDLFTSHEGLLLEYEQNLTRLLRRSDSAATRTKVSTTNSDDLRAYYDTSAHFIWIGDRTRQIDGAHVEFFRGIENPIGIKVGPTTSIDDLLALLRSLNPKREVGKITLITRYGCKKVAELLSKHIRAVEDSEYASCVVWQCDPMHGNTRSTPSGVKTRQFADIFSELSQTMEIHKQEGSYLGGMHLELTGEAVTECTGGGAGLGEEDLVTNYTTYCDPRLNEKQALEMAFLVAGAHREERPRS